jgi:hypothetical protein
MAQAMALWTTPFMPNLLNTCVFLVETAQCIAVSSVVCPRHAYSPALPLQQAYPRHQAAAPISNTPQ